MVGAFQFSITILTTIGTIKIILSDPTGQVAEKLL